VEEFGQCSTVILNNALVRLHASQARPARRKVEVTQLDELVGQPGQFQNPPNGPIRIAVRYRASADADNLNAHGDSLQRMQGKLSSRSSSHYSRLVLASRHVPLVIPAAWFVCATWGMANAFGLDTIAVGSRFLSEDEL
jgi:hypothetical protein